MKFRTDGVVLTWLVLLAVAGCAPVGKMTHDMDAMIESATTRADHETLASHYEQEAKALRDKAEEHRRMAQAYERSRIGKPGATLAQHCDFLARTYQEAAKQNLELAKEHHLLAEAVSK